MDMKLPILVAAALACCPVAAAPPTAAPSMGPAVAPARPKAATVEAFVAPAAAPARVHLAAPEPGTFDAMKAANASAVNKRLDIGIGREVDPSQGGAHATRWTAIAGGHVARWEIRSEGAVALRVSVRAEGLDPGVQLRFAGAAQPRLVYGPLTHADVGASGPYWSPVLEGDTALVEAFVPSHSPLPSLAISAVSHLFVSPANPRAETLAKAAGACEVNLICRSATDPVLAQTARSVARMSFISATGGSALCTGTLLNAGDGAPYFYSAAHCISSPSSARSLTTHWFEETTTCTGTAVNPSYVQVAGGAQLLYANVSSDALFMRLNSQPPAAAVYAGWDAAAVARTTPATAIHHPQGDVKKVSYGTIAGFMAVPEDNATDIRVQWNATVTGVVEPGSSGSGIFIDTGAGLRLRGGLRGGPSSCTAPTASLYDQYSRFDLAFPFIAPFLSPGAAPALGGNVAANPGFESGAASWTQSSGAIVTNDASTARTGSWYAWMGGANNLAETLYQAIAVPPGPARLQFWYRINTAETSSTTPFDRLEVSVNDASSGASLQSLGSLSNLDATSGWVQSPIYDLSAFGGRTVRLQLRVTTDISDLTSFRVDDVTVNGAPAALTANNTALWYNGAESGWGINVNQQGDIAFATLFTYSSTGGPMWLVMPAGSRQQGANVFSGALYRTTGPAFNANPFTPIGPANITEVGAMTLDFTGATAAIGYTMNDTYVSKNVEKQVFGLSPANCQGTTGSRAGATNYQDLWWNPAESGWGLNLTHQGNTMFGTLFTYAANGQGLWLVLPAGVRQADGSYLGDLYRTTGPAFNANPFTPIGPGNITQVGTMRLRFSNGENGTLEYTVDGASVTKAITRQVFSSPVPVCSG